jgi:hypothetical protein
MRISNKYFRLVLGILLILGILFNLFSVLWPQKDKYLAHNYWENYKNLEDAYLGSQYVNKHPKGWLPDEAVFAYAGGAFIKGINPVLVIVDAPPLGKYLIGLSTLLFDNPHVVVVLFGILSLLLFYFLANQVLENKILALLSVLFYSSEPIFKNQFIYTPLLDLFQLVFLLGYFYYINKAFLAKKFTIPFFLLISILLGCFISTKFFISGTTVIAASLLWTLLHRDLKKFFGVLAASFIAGCILLLTYVRVFAFGYNLHRFLGIQKYIFLYHKSQIILPFSVWPLLLFNRWYVWFGDKPIISDKQWAISWPIITVLSFVTMAAYLFKKINKNPHLEVLMLWTICYLAFLSTGQIFSRYLLILLPVLYIISIYGLLSFTQKFIKRTNQNKSLKERVPVRNLTAKKRNTKKK